MSCACSSSAGASVRGLLRGRVGDAFAGRTSLAAASTPAAAATNRSSSRLFSTSPPAYAKPRRGSREGVSLRNEKTFQFDDVPSCGHMLIGRHREFLKYARIVHWELPKLIAMRKPYVPPSTKEVLRVRSVHFQGEQRAVTTTSNICVRVQELFSSGALKSDAARRKFLLLAGTRWTPLEKRPVQSTYKQRQRGYENSKAAKRDAAVAAKQPPLPPVLDIWAQQDEIEKAALGTGVGVVKISCHRFPHERMNLKWCSDTMDKMIEEANTNPEEFSSIPLDLRHVKARETKAKGFAKYFGPTISDFPKQWLSNAS